jgi:hypothetical protein
MFLLLFTLAKDVDAASVEDGLPALLAMWLVSLAFVVYFAQGWISALLPK